MTEHNKKELLVQIRRVIESTDGAKLNKCYTWYIPKRKEGCVAGMCGQDKWFNEQGFTTEQIKEHPENHHVPAYEKGLTKTYSWQAIDTFFKDFPYGLRAKLFGTRGIVMMLSKEEVIKVIDKELEQIHA